MDSTAASLRSRVLKKDEQVKWTNCEHLLDIYRKMKSSAFVADYSDINKTLKTNAKVECQANLEDATLGVIVETRKSELLEYVILNFIRQTNLRVQLFHGLENKEFILAGNLLKYVVSGQIILYELSTNSLKAPAYNALFLTREFWQIIAGRGKIFVFQADSIICENSDYCLNDFLDFDYIGSGWSRKRPVDLIIDGGSGGLSIRDWHKSVECLETFPSELWKGGEDGFFAFHIELLAGKVGNIIECGKFSTQDFFTHNSFGAHQVSRLPSEQQKKFLNYSPEAKFMLPSVSNK